VNLETPANMNSEKSEIGHVENSEELALQIISKIKEKLDCCYDKNGPAAQIGSEPLWNAIAQLKYKGTKLRLITEITKENIAYCKTMMRYFDVRHMDGVKGNFGISDGVEYIGNMLAFDGKPGMQLIHMNDKPFIELQQFLFDTLWGKAIQAREKIKEIELGLDKEFIETIRNPLEIQQLVHNLLKSATYEILILFSTINSFYRAKQENILEMLKESVERGVNVRMLAPAEDDAIKEISEKKLKERRKQIHIQHIRKPLQTNIITIIIDQTISLSIEINDDTKETLRESAGLATYSNSESNVSSCASIFESLWIQSELDKQNKIKQVYFQVFKGFGLKDETYKRSWQSENS
jgi:phosphoheptose isomerase